MVFAGSGPGPGAKVSRRGGQRGVSCLSSCAAVPGSSEKTYFAIVTGKASLPTRRECRSTGALRAALGGVLLLPRVLVFERELWPQRGSGYPQESQKPVTSPPPAEMQALLLSFPGAAPSRWVCPCPHPPPLQPGALALSSGPEPSGLLQGHKLCCCHEAKKGAGPVLCGTTDRDGQPEEGGGGSYSRRWRLVLCSRSEVGGRRVDGPFVAVTES